MLFYLIILLLSCFSIQAKVVHKVHCTPSSMRIEILKTQNTKSIYLKNLKDYPKCQPEKSGKLFIFDLPLDDTFYLCGTTKVVNKMTGGTVFYHRIIVEYKDAKENSELLLVKCNLKHDSNTTQDRNKREVLPAGFQEPEDLDITGVLVKEAPTPELTMAVKQKGRTIGTDLTVQPGTPLTMEIKLDSKSAEVYGILTNLLEVSDTKNKKEIIVTKGCSVDTFLFGNFQTSNGDDLYAKFRAFKFPESAYVLFQSILNVCLDNCKPKTCSNGDSAFGRKKRAIPKSDPDYPNMIFEVSMTTYIKVMYTKEIPLLKGSLSGYYNEAPDVSGYYNDAPDVGEGFVEPIENHRSLQYTEYSKSGTTAARASLSAIATLLLTSLLL